MMIPCLSLHTRSHIWHTAEAIFIQNASSNITEPFLLWVTIIGALLLAIHEIVSLSKSLSVCLMKVREAGTHEMHNTRWIRTTLVGWEYRSSLTIHVLQGEWGGSYTHIHPIQLQEVETYPRQT